MSWETRVVEEWFDNHVLGRGDWLLGMWVTDDITKPEHIAKVLDILEYFKTNPKLYALSEEEKDHIAFLRRQGLKTTIYESNIRILSQSPIIYKPFVNIKTKRAKQICEVVILNNIYSVPFTLASFDETNEIIYIKGYSAHVDIIMKLRDKENNCTELAEGALIFLIDPRTNKAELVQLVRYR